MFWVDSTKTMIPIIKSGIPKISKYGFKEIKKEIIMIAIPTFAFILDLVSN